MHSERFTVSFWLLGEDLERLLGELIMLYVWGGEVNRGTLKRPAHHLHEKATTGGWTRRVFRNSKIQNLRFFQGMRIKHVGL